jgi:hypothetical protein
MVPELDPEQTVALELVDPPTVLQLKQSSTKHYHSGFGKYYLGNEPVALHILPETPNLSSQNNLVAQKRIGH